MKGGKVKKLVPFDDSKCTDKCWNKDVFDDFIPKRKGFITDCLYMLRGSEAPTMFTIWSVLIILSMAVKREAWINFGLIKKFANLYVILVGKAGLAKKTFSIDVLLPILYRSHRYIKDPCLRKVKKFVTIADQVTPEGIIDAMYQDGNALPSNFPLAINGKPVMNKDGTQRIFRRANEQLIVSSELANLLGKQIYLEGMIALLLEIYDNKATRDKRTVKNSKITLYNLYTSFLGATTPDGFQNSIPLATKGDGFLSRVILANCPDSGRVCPFPKIVKGAPTEDDLAKRLAWISLNVSGEYNLTEDAYEWYEKWYTEYKSGLRRGDEFAVINSRMDGNLLKIALLLRANLYEPGKQITVEDLEESMTLLKATAQFTKFLVEDLDAGDWGKMLTRVDSYIKNKVKVQRTDCLRAFSKAIKARELNEILDRLMQEERIIITDTSGKAIKRVRSEGTDWYHYKLI